MFIMGWCECVVGKCVDDGGDGVVDVCVCDGGFGVVYGEMWMLGTNSAFASAGVVFAGRELVWDGDDGDWGYGLWMVEEVWVRVYVEEELKWWCGEVVEDDVEASGAAVAGGDDNRGVEFWFMVIEEVDVLVEWRM